MTTGEPLVVRCAMKPLPTLTKPLRSVDIATREPAAGAARAHRLLHRARPPAWWGRRCWRSCSPSAYREKFGGDHIDDVRAALAAYEERIGWKRRRPDTARWSSSASWAPARRPAARAAGRGAGRRARSTPTTCSSSASASSIEDYFASHGERAFREAEEEVGLRAARGAARAGALARRRRDRAPSACASCSPATPSCCSTSTPRPPGSAPAARRPLARDRERFDGAARRARAALRRRWPTRSCPTARRDAVRRALPALRDLAHARRARSCCGRRGVGDYPVYVGEGVLDGALLAGPRPRASSSPTRPSARCYARAARRTSRRDVRDRRRARRPRRWRPPSACCAALADAGMDHDDHVVALGGGVVGDVAGFCAAVYQRGVRGRAGADDARRAGRLRLRRQDRRRPAGGQELRRRLPPAARPCSPTRRRWRRCRRPSSPPAGPR